MAVVIVGSANADVGLDDGWAVLGDGGSALDAVEAAIRPVEANPDDHTVGFGGYPNLLGQVELDACLIDGATRRTGAVAALRGYVHAITVARAVMDRTPHVLVAGEGAARLASEIGMTETDLLTPEAEEVWRAGLSGGDPGGVAGRMLSEVVGLVSDPDLAGGTVNVLALDGAGHLASGVSTSGWAWKYPGRLGDSPVAGAGSWCDDRWGAAACTGWGELAVRAGTARTCVELMARGAPVEEAVVAALDDALDVARRAGRDLVVDRPRLHVVALAADGTHAAASTVAGTEYVWRDGAVNGLHRSPRAAVAARDA